MLQYSSISAYAQPARSTGTAVLILAAAGHLLGGCMSLVSHTGGAAPLANGITEYSSPTFDNRIAPPGWLCIGGATAFGAWKGFTSNLALRWTGWERRSEVQPIGNGLLGALSGAASGLLITLVTGGGTPRVTSDNAAEWLDKLDDRMVLVPPDSLHPGLPLVSIRGIARNADAAYVIHTMEDARLFLEVFHDSPHRDRVLLAGIAELRRDSLPAFARLARSLPAERLAMERYISEATALEETIRLAGRLPEYRATAERRAAELVLTFTDLRRFMQAFPESALTENLALRVSERLQRDEIPEFIRLFPLLMNQHELKVRYLNSFSTITETIDAGHRYPEFRPEAERRAAALAHSVPDYRTYLEAFPEGAAAPEIRQRLRLALRAMEPTDDADDNGNLDPYDAGNQ